ncbi:hypothetical protein K8Q96_00215, partial [Candidatus Nomurabacteria bacterium]|nr:hypothetical protein [Candidatus Nomurabacteria bacterium]
MFLLVLGIFGIIQTIPQYANALDWSTLFGSNSNTSVKDAASNTVYVPVGSDEQLTLTTVEKSLPSVVSVQASKFVSTRTNQNQIDPFFNEFFFPGFNIQLPQEQQPQKNDNKDN